MFDGLTTDSDDLDDAPLAPPRRRVHLPIFATFVRPVTVGDCRNGPRPCPLVSCELHLATKLVLDLPDDASDDDVAALLSSLPATCAQDVVDANANGASLEDVGNVFGVSDERIRQIENKATARLLRASKRERLSEHLITDDALEPWERERSSGRGGPARFAETLNAHEPPPEHLAHLPLVGAVEDVASSFWCDPLRAEMTALRCIARQTARQEAAHRAPKYPLCAGCTEGNAMRERVRVRDDVTTPETTTLTTAPDEARERTIMLHETPTKTAKTPAAQLNASATPTTTTEAAPLCEKCRLRPIGNVWPTTPKGTEKWCGICRRIESAERNGSSYGGTKQEGVCACGCGQNRAAMREGTPAVFAKFCGSHRKVAWDRVKKQGETPENAAAWVIERYTKPATKSVTTSTKTRSAVVVPVKPPTAPVPAVVPAPVVEEVAVAAPPSPPELKLEPSPALSAFVASLRDPKPVAPEAPATTAESIREGFAIAARAKACALRVGGIDVLEALVSGVIESGFVVGR